MTTSDLRATAEGLIALSEKASAEKHTIHFGNEHGNRFRQACKIDTITTIATALIAALDVIDIVRHDYSAIEIVDAVKAFDTATAEKQP